MVADQIDIEQSLRILLATSIGERVMQPLYGCNLRDYQFEPVNNTYLGFVRDLIERAILFFEPRIVVEAIEVQADPDEIFEGKVVISITYRITQTNTRHNFVYPFYQREADKRI
jgi:uncharacterized protein